MAHIGYLDDLVKEYLTFRGFAHTLKAFESDLKSDKEKGHRVDRIVDQLLTHISNHDLNALRELWSHLSLRLFSRLETTKISSVSKLEAGLLKLFLVNCIQTKHSDKVRDFFEKMTPELQGLSEWRDWFALPFVKNPEDNPIFSLYFSRQWQDTLMLSIFNFLSIVYSCMPLPRLAEFQNTSLKLRKLREENEALRAKLGLNNPKNDDILSPEVPPPPDVMDDFYIIAAETPSTTASNDSSSSTNQAKTLKNFLRNLTTNANISDKKSKPSRSSSRSRTSNPQPSNTSAHVPVRRVTPPIPSNESSTSLTDYSLPQPTTQSTSSSSTSRLAYLLLGQEEYSEHRSEVTHCKFSANGYVLASSDVDGVIKIWCPTPAPQTLATFISNSGVTALDWVFNSERHFVYGTKSGVIRLCDRNDRISNEISLTSNGNSVIQLTNGSGSLLSVSTGDPEFFLYDLKASKVERDLSSSLLPLITTSVFNHNSQMLIVGGIDGKIRVFDLRRRDLISSWMVSSEAVTTLQLSGSDENGIHVLSKEGHISNWSLVSMGSKISEQLLDDCYFNFESYPRSAWGKQFAFTSDGKHLLTCSISGGIIYERGSNTLVKVLGLKGHKTHATCVDWSTANNDCGPCVTADTSGQIRVSTLLSQ